jgi:hypothetical protein
MKFCPLDHDYTNNCGECEMCLDDDEVESPVCEICGFSLVDSTQGMCNCGKYKW